MPRGAGRHGWLQAVGMARVWFTVAFWSLHSKARSLTTQTQCVERAAGTAQPLTASVCSYCREDRSHPNCRQVRCHGHGAHGDGGKAAGCGAGLKGPSGCQKVLLKPGNASVRTCALLSTAELSFVPLPGSSHCAELELLVLHCRPAR